MLTDIYTLPLTDEKLQQNMPDRFLEIPVFLGDYFIMPHPVHIYLRPFTSYSEILVGNRNFFLAPLHLRPRTEWPLGQSR